MMRKRERGEIKIDLYDFFVITMVSSVVLSAFSYNIEPTIATPKSRILVLPSNHSHGAKGKHHCSEYILKNQ